MSRVRGDHYQHWNQQFDHQKRRHEKRRKDRDESKRPRDFKAAHRKAISCANEACTENNKEH